MLILGILLLVASLILLIACAAITGEVTSTADGFALGICFILGLFTIIESCDTHEEPSAMDVYQGKTTIQYTVVDGVATDSTVVWKDVIPQ